MDRTNNTSQVLLFLKISDYIKNKNVRFLLKSIIIFSVVLLINIKNLSLFYLPTIENNISINFMNNSNLSNFDITKENNKNVGNHLIRRNLLSNRQQDKFLSSCFKGILLDSKKYNKTKNPKISIIITTYNQKNYILRALRSIQNQSFKTLEIIYSDDCSTDGTIETIKKYQEEDKRIILIEHKKNEGTLINRNDGARIAKGKYIIFLDGDDLLLNNILSITYSIAENRNYDIIQFKSYEGYNIKGKIGKNFPLKKRGIYQPRLGSYLYYGKGNLSLIDCNIWGKLIKRKIFLETLYYIGDEYLNNHMILNEDRLVIFMLYRTANSFYHIDYYGYFHINNKNSKMKKILEGINCDKTIKDNFTYLKYMFVFTMNLRFEKAMAVDQYFYMNSSYGFCFEKITEGFDYYYNVTKLYLDCNKISETDKNKIKKIEQKIKNREEKVKNLKAL